MTPLSNVPLERTMELLLFSFVLFSYISESQGEYCAVSVPDHHNSYQIRCSSSCCGSGYETRCCVSGDMIVGIFFACVACITILVTLLYCCIKHKNSRGLRSNSHSELSFIGSHNRFYQPYPAQPIKPPPYKQHDPPPSYTEQQDTQRSTSQTRISSSPPAYTNTTNNNNIPRQILVSSPPPPYDFHFTSHNLSTEYALGGQQALTEQVMVHRGTSADNRAVRQLSITDLGDPNPTPSTSVSVVEEQSTANQGTSDQRVTDMFSVAHIPNNKSLSSGSSQTVGTSIRQKSGPFSAQAINVQNHLKTKQNGRRNKQREGINRQSSQETNTKQTLEKTNTV